MHDSLGVTDIRDDTGARPWEKTKPPGRKVLPGAPAGRMGRLSEVPRLRRSYPYKKPNRRLAGGLSLTSNGLSQSEV